MALYLTKMLNKLLVLLQAILLMSGCAAFMGFRHASRIEVRI